MAKTAVLPIREGEVRRSRREDLTRASAHMFYGLKWFLRFLGILTNLGLIFVGGLLFLNSSIGDHEYGSDSYYASLYRFMFALAVGFLFLACGGGMIYWELKNWVPEGIDQVKVWVFLIAYYMWIGAMVIGASYSLNTGYVTFREQEMGVTLGWMAWYTAIGTSFVMFFSITCCVPPSGDALERNEKSHTLRG